MTVSRPRVLIVIAALGVIVIGAVVWFGVVEGAKACTKVGCVNAVGFEWSSLDASTRANAATVTLCANGECTTTNAASTSDLLVQTTLDDPVVRSASLSIKDATGEELIHADLAGEHEAHESTPNGPDCEPTCWWLGLALVDGALTAR